MLNHSADSETPQQRFETILSREPFKGLKAILDSLSADRQAQYVGVTGTNSYGELVSRLGYRIILTKQIHVQDSYSRLSPAGGIKTVLPYHDIPTQGSLPTLISFDHTVTTTPKAESFFNQMLAAFKAQLGCHT